LIPGEELTNDTAIRILRQIQRESELLSFATKPAVLLSISLSLSIISLAMLPASGTAFLVADLFCTIFGIGMLGPAILLCCGYPKDLANLSHLYAEYSKKVQEHLDFIDSHDDLTFVWGCPT